MYKIVTHILQRKAMLAGGRVTGRIVVACVVARINHVFLDNWNRPTEHLGSRLMRGHSLRWGRGEGGGGGEKEHQDMTKFGVVIYVSVGHITR